MRADIDIEELQEREGQRRRHQQQQAEEDSKKQLDSSPSPAAAAAADKDLEQQHQQQERHRRHHHHHPLSAAGGPGLRDGASQIAAAPEWAVPSGAWVRKFVADFQQLRRQVADVYESGGELALGGAWVGG